MESEVSFSSDGLALAGNLHLPEGYAAGDRPGAYRCDRA